MRAFTLRQENRGQKSLNPFSQTVRRSSLFAGVVLACVLRARRRRAIQKTLPAEFLNTAYVSLRHVAFAVKDPDICAQFCVECLGMFPGPQTSDFNRSGMRWVESRSSTPFKLHFIPNSTQEDCYVDVFNKMRTLINGNLDVWTQFMDNHICIGYHNAADLIEKIIQNRV